MAWVDLKKSYYSILVYNKIQKKLSLICGCLDSLKENYVTKQLQLVYQAIWVFFCSRSWNYFYYSDTAGTLGTYDLKFLFALKCSWYLTCKTYGNCITLFTNHLCIQLWNHKFPQVALRRLASSPKAVCNNVITCSEMREVQLPWKGR